MTDGRNKERQLRYLTQSIRLKEAASPRLVRLTMTATSLSVLAFFVWSAVTNVHEIAHSPGEIMPSGFEQVVQHFEGGIVREILVREGDSVGQGQALLRLDGAGAEQDLRRAQEQKTAYDMQIESLRAFIGQRPPQFRAGAADQALLRDQATFFASMTDAKRKTIAVIDDQVAQKKRGLEMLVADLDTAEQSRAILRDLYERRAALNSRGYLPDTQMLEAKENYNQVEGQVRNLSAQISTARSALAEYESRRASAAADNLNEASQKLDGITAASAQNDQVIGKLEERVARLEVKSPVRGIVKGLNVNTVGGVVQPGQTLMNIIPTDAPLIVSLKIPPRYIGHLAPGQPVQVKFSSFDFSRYGSVGARLEFISAAAFTAENGERYYQGRASLDSDYVGSRNNRFVPGMTVMADIVTGDKTVLEYLLKPIRNALSTAFTER